MRLSQLTNVNDNMVIQYVVQMDTADTNARYDAQKKLDQAGNLVIEPVKDVVSIGFYMKSGNAIFLKSDIKRTVSEIRQCPWYQDALREPNSVKIGSYQTIGASDLYLVVEGPAGTDLCPVSQCDDRQIPECGNGSAVSDHRCREFHPQLQP